MKVFVTGISFKKCPIETREKLCFSSDQLDAIYREVNSYDVSELMVLSTCNRVEIYGCAESESTWSSFILELFEKYHDISGNALNSYLYSHQEDDAVRHLFRVASGLDSMVVGENEILGQIRDNFKKAYDMDAIHSIFYRLLEKSLKIGKDVRTKTKINKGAVSVPTAALELAKKIFGHLGDEKVMVMGTGDMGRLTLESLYQSGAQIHCIAGRNEESGKELAEKYEANWVNMENWQENLQGADILISSTASSEPIIGYEDIREIMNQRKRGKPLFLIDIAVPRDIDQECHKINDVFLYDIDDLQDVSSSNLKLRKKEIVHAEKIIENGVEEFHSWLNGLSARPMMEKFEGFVGEILNEEFDRLANRESIDPERINDAKHRIKSKVMHYPFLRIKEASKNGGVKKYLEAIQSLFNLK